MIRAGRARLVMKLGRCSVHAPDGAQGFRVETPLTAVVDLGTGASASHRGRVMLGGLYAGWMRERTAAVLG